MKRVALCCILAACGDVRPPPVPSFAVTFMAESDPGLPLAGVVVLANGATQGTSGVDGIVQTSLQGRTGASVSITYRCPDGYRAQDESQTLRLHRFEGVASDAGTSAGLQMRLACRPVTRGVAFVVRSGGRTNIPVLLNGREVTRTNVQGLAHIVLRSPPGQTYQIKLGTDDFPSLQPRNPVMTYSVGEADEVFVFNQEFSEQSNGGGGSSRARRRRSAPPPPPIAAPASSIMRITRIP